MAQGDLWNFKGDNFDILVSILFMYTSSFSRDGVVDSDLGLFLVEWVGPFIPWIMYGLGVL